MSNNHVADGIFNFLGGIGKFRTFMKRSLSFDEQQIQFINGSGNSIISDSSTSKSKSYNKASCRAVVITIREMQLDLHNKYNMSLMDVMPVAGADGGTLSPRYDSIENSMVAKTGTVDPAITLAGLVTTQMGKVYFGVLMDTNGPGDWNTARNKIREKVMDLINMHGGRRSFSYTKSAFLPFDRDSAFMKIETNLGLLP